MRRSIKTTNACSSFAPSRPRSDKAMASVASGVLSPCARLATWRHAHRELSAHAQPAQKTKHVEAPNAVGEHAQAREYGVTQDGDRHRLDAPDAIAQYAEQNAADGPPDHEDRRRPRR